MEGRWQWIGCFSNQSLSQAPTLQKRKETTFSLHGQRGVFQAEGTVSLSRKALEQECTQCISGTSSKEVLYSHHSALTLPGAWRILCTEPWIALSSLWALDLFLTVEKSLSYLMPSAQGWLVKYTMKEQVVSQDRRARSEEYLPGTHIRAGDVFGILC